ncbi:polysaccharide deacetylase family protein [Candidatus Woesearchaeota archaeon]|nr:polysaccharide deacetylase family protein [Candidatus Woesearchaeota archaeon]
MKAAKIILYDFFGSRIGKSILNLLSHFVYANNLKKINKKNNNAPKKFLVCITIDTESGYVKDNDERAWQKDEPEAYIGYYKGVENWRNLLNEHNAKATFFLSTNCFNARNEGLTKIDDQLKLLLKEKHEIGLHMHPDSDQALQIALKEKFHYTGAKFYDYDKINKFIKIGKELIQKNIGINPTSFRWGNWALNTDAVKALQANGFNVDSSATPGISGHLNAGMHYDWSKAREHYPWKLSLKDYQNTISQDSKIIEIPIATFKLFGVTLRADPVYSELLNSAFDHYYRNADRSEKPFAFMVISHSIEATHEDGSITRVIKDMGEFINHAKKLKDVEFVTVNTAYKGINQ